MARLIVLILAGVLVPGAAPGAAPAGSGWREAPAYAALFAPAGPRGAAYRTFVSPLGLDETLAQVARMPGRLAPPGAWQPRPLAPADAFGTVGTYDHWTLLRLYGARLPRVARGPVGNGDGAVTEAWTLISPYPDPSLQRLEPGTLLIVLSLGQS